MASTNKALTIATRLCCLIPVTMYSALDGVALCVTPGGVSPVAVSGPTCRLLSEVDLRSSGMTPDVSAVASSFRFRLRRSATNSSAA